MDAAMRKMLRLQAETVINALGKNNMLGFYVEKKDDVVLKVEELLHKGDTVAVGGSRTLAETGVIDRLRGGEYRFLDRYRPGLTEEQVREIFLQSFRADAYLSSVNAITMQGELYNVDGNSNRVAAICYGPRSVILVAGCNKIVKDIPAAITRVKKRAAPANAIRLRADTPCARTGVCAGLHSDRMTTGCACDSRICCNYVVSARQREKDRIKVILVGEDLGY